MMKKNRYSRVFCLVGLVLTLASCSPKDNEKIYPYNYNPDQDYYLTEDEMMDNFDVNSSDNIAIVRENQSRFAPPEGMVFTPLFAEPAANDRARFKRLEAAVQILRNDVDVLIPRVFKISEQQYAAESKKAAAGKVPANIVVSASGVTGEPIKLGKQEVNKAPVAIKAGAADIKTVRIADHKDLTRVVLDVTGDVKIKAVVSPDGKDMVIDIASIKNFVPAATWNALSGLLISGYKIEGSNLHLELMYPSKINHQSLLKPNKDSKYYRFVIDLVSDHVHKK